jgi:hypothetical protein
MCCVLDVCNWAGAEGLLYGVGRRCFSSGKCCLASITYFCLTDKLSRHLSTLVYVSNQVSPNSINWLIQVIYTYGKKYKKNYGYVKIQSVHGLHKTETSNILETPFVRFCLINVTTAYTSNKKNHFVRFCSTECGTALNLSQL